MPKKLDTSEHVAPILPLPDGKSSGQLVDALSMSCAMLAGSHKALAWTGCQERYSQDVTGCLKSVLRGIRDACDEDGSEHSNLNHCRGISCYRKDLG